MSRDIGRRRALGATRSTIVVNAAICAVLGVVVGVGFGVIVTTVIAHAMPPVPFAFGVGALMVLASVVGSVPPAIRAARLDPVRILRVP